MIQVDSAVCAIDWAWREALARHHPLSILKLAVLTISDPGMVLYGTPAPVMLLLSGFLGLIEFGRKPVKYIIFLYRDPDIVIIRVAFAE